MARRFSRRSALAAGGCAILLAACATGPAGTTTPLDGDPLGPTRDARTEGPDVLPTCARMVPVSGATALPTALATSTTSRAGT